MVVVRLARTTCCDLRTSEGRETRNISEWNDQYTFSDVRCSILLRRFVDMNAVSFNEMYSNSTTARRESY